MFKVIIAVIVAASVCSLALAGGRNCGFGYCPQYYPSYPSYQSPFSYQYPTPDLVYVQSAVLYNSFSFQYQPPTTILQLYGVPQINSVTTTTTTTSAVSNGAVQQVVNGQQVGGASANLSQFTADGAPVARLETQPRNELVGDPHSATAFLSLSGPKKCVSCHGSGKAAGGFEMASYNRNDRAQRRKVMNYITSGKCPQGGTTLTPEEEAQFVLGR